MLQIAQEERQAACTGLMNRDRTRNCIIGWRLELSVSEVRTKGETRGRMRRFQGLLGVRVQMSLL